MIQTPNLNQADDQADGKPAVRGRASTSQARGSTWLVPGTTRAIWRRFRDDCRTLGPAAWRAIGTTLMVGFVLTLLLTVGLVLLGQWLQGRGLQAWDIRTLQWVASAGPLTFANAITWQAPGDLLFQPIMVIGFVALAAYFSRPLIAASMAATYILSFAFIWTGWLLWNRPRPDLIAGGIAAPGLHSFPSGHAVLTLSVYGLVAYLWIRASHSTLERVVAIVLVTIWTLMVGTARLALGSHWPSDVLAGYLIGFVWLVAVVVALRHAERAAGQSG